MLEDLKPERQTYTCIILTHSLALDEKDAAIYWAAIGNPVDWSTSSLARQLSLKGLKMSEQSLMRHRKGSCSCAR